MDEYELYDFIDDYFTEECDFDSPHSRNGEVDGERTFALLMDKRHTLEEIREALGKLDPAEIERIWLLNNKHG